MNNATQLKAKIRNMAATYGVPAQVVLQNYMIESLLERISKSSYQANFILKGGILITSLIGISNRTTMDLDVTTRNLSFNKKNIKNVFMMITAIDLNDGISYEIKKIETIRERSTNNGVRVFLVAHFDTIRVSLKVDLTTGDSITPDAIPHDLNMLFRNKSLTLLSYNIETQLAEKIESILDNEIANTRLKDYYDVCVIGRMRFSKDVLSRALRATCQTRNSTYLLENPLEIIASISNNQTMKSRWKRYQREHAYAQGISFPQIISVLETLVRK